MNRNWNTSSKRRAIAYVLLAIAALAGAKSALGEASQLPEEKSHSRSIEGLRRGNDPTSDGKDDATKPWWTRRWEVEKEAEDAESGTDPQGNNDPTSDGKDDATSKPWWTRRPKLEKEAEHAELVDTAEQLNKSGEEIARSRRKGRKNSNRVDTVETEQPL